jgi:uncharacterized protein (DUF433 family)/predicted nuclease of predicted toxin-antitoxin system
MELLDRITVETEKCGRRPCVRGMRIRVTDILGSLAGDPLHEDILRDFPYPEPDDIKAALAYALARPTTRSWRPEAPRRLAASPSPARWISRRDHEAIRVVDVTMHAAGDAAIWEHAEANACVLVTKDEDFVDRWGRFVETRARSFVQDKPVDGWVRMCAVCMFALERFIAATDQRACAFARTSANGGDTGFQVWVIVTIRPTPLHVIRFHHFLS